MLPNKLFENALVAQTLSRPTATARRSLLNLFIPNGSIRALDSKIVDCIKGFDGDRHDRHIFKEVDRTGRYSYVMIGVA